jgi:hypothetical protein
MHPTASHRYPTAGDLYVPCLVICTKSLKQSYSPDLEPILYIFAVVLICNVDRILLREQLRQTKNDMNFYRQPNLTLHGMHRHTAHAPASGALSQAVGGDQVCALRTSISDLNLGMSMLTGFRIASQILSCRRSLVYLSSRTERPAPRQLSTSSRTVGTTCLWSKTTRLPYRRYPTAKQSGLGLSW